MNTIVVSNVHRPALITPHIGYLNPVVSLTPDWPYHCIGHFRCFMGHTAALTRCMTEDIALVFEDDAVPDHRHDWKRAIEAGRMMVESGRCEIACLHGRGFDYERFSRFEAFGFNWLKPITEDRWVLGTLCYVIGRKAAERWIAQDFWLHGTNIDLFVWSNRFDFCMIDPSPFIHDRSQGSILEAPKNTEYVIR